MRATELLKRANFQYKSVARPDKEVNATVAADWLGSPDEPLKGFPWKSSTKRETTGIIFWSDIFLYDSPKGDRIAIYLMDTQGLFDHSSTPTDNIRIFSLSALVSSVQIMNIFNMIEESHLEYLQVKMLAVESESLLKFLFQFATEIARFTAVETDSDSKPFQKLMFIIRDWISPDEYNYGLKGGNKFIKMFLRIKDFHSTELQAVRNYLQKTFESISCFLMPYPGKTTARNSSFDGRWSAIDEDFVESMKELFPILLAPSNLTVKTINNVPIKAFELSVYVKQYVDLFKSEHMPEAKTIYESTLDNQLQILMSKAVEVYLESISLYQENIKNPAEIDQLHLISKTLALNYFDDEKKFGSAEDGLVFRKQLDDKLEKAATEWKPVTLEFLGKIKVEQKKTDDQKKLATNAQKRDEVAKQEAEVADKRYEKLQKEIAQARYDTAEARRDAENTRKLLQKAQLDREQALRKEQETHLYYKEMNERVALYERQLLMEKEKAAQRVNERVGAVRKRDGVLQWFGAIGEGITSFFGFLGKAVVSIFT